MMRFAEPVRGGTAEAEALERLVAAGEVVFTDEDADERDSADEGDADAEREEEDVPFPISEAELAELDPSDDAIRERAPAEDDA